MHNLDEWVVRDTVCQFGGLHEGKEWAMQVVCNPFGLYFARCEYSGNTEFVGLYSDPKIAEQAGFQKVVSMLEA